MSRDRIMTMSGIYMDGDEEDADNNSIVRHERPDLSAKSVVVIHGPQYAKDVCMLIYIKM